MKLENIDKSIQKQDILQDISLEVSPQKLTAFIGPNGAGKSTLLSIMSRLTKKDQGILSIKGREIESWNSQELAQEHYIVLPTEISKALPKTMKTISQKGN